MHKLITTNNLPVVAVNAIILDEWRREVLLTRRQDTGEWCLPGGLVEAGETVSAALIREVFEEIGIKCRIARFVGVYSINNITPIRMRSIILVFECQVVGGGTPTISDEVCEIGFFDVAELPNMISAQQERIYDAVNIVECIVK